MEEIILKPDELVGLKIKDMEFDADRSNWLMTLDDGSATIIRFISGIYKDDHR